MQNQFTNIAFISYKREDEKWAKWLQKKLEHYQLPVEIRKQNVEFAERPRHVFKDTTDLSGGVLEKAIKAGLESSKFLIVICSPRAAQSPWVCKEVQEFIDLGREEYIIPFIVEGEPYSNEIGKECFPKALLSLAGDRELLGININENGRDIAYIKVLARLFDVRFDTLWQRHVRYRRLVRNSVFLFLVLCIMVVSIVANRFIRMSNQIGSQYEQLSMAYGKLDSVSLVITKERDRAIFAQEKFLVREAFSHLHEGDSEFALSICLELFSCEPNSLWKYIGENDQLLRQTLAIGRSKGWHSHCKSLCSGAINQIFLVCHDSLLITNSDKIEGWHSDDKKIVFSDFPWYSYSLLNISPLQNYISTTCIGKSVNLDRIINKDSIVGEGGIYEGYRGELLNVVVNDSGTVFHTNARERGIFTRHIVYGENKDSESYLPIEVDVSSMGLSFMGKCLVFTDALRHFFVHWFDTKRTEQYEFCGADLVPASLHPFVVWGSESGITMYDYESSVSKSLHNGGMSRIWALSYDDSKILFESGRKLYLYDVVDKSIINTFHLPVGLTSAAISSSGDDVFLGLSSGEVITWKYVREDYYHNFTGTWSRVKDCNAHFNYSKTMPTGAMGVNAYSGCCRLVRSFDGLELCFFYDAEEYRPLYKLPEYSPIEDMVVYEQYSNLTPLSIAFDLEEIYVLALFDNGLLRVFDPVSQEEFLSLDVSGFVGDLSYDPEDVCSAFAVFSEDGKQVLLCVDGAIYSYPFERYTELIKLATKKFPFSFLSPSEKKKLAI